MKSNFKISSKKAQLGSILIVIISLFIVGIVLFFMNHLNEKIYTSLDEYMEDTPDLNQTEAHQTVEKLQSIEQSHIWDYVFLAIFIGLMIQMLILSFATKINIAFFWIFILIGIIILVVGVMLSNIWQETASNPEFALTITRFPITNALLGTYFPTVIVAILFLGMIVLFGKFPGREQT